MLKIILTAALLTMTGITTAATTTSTSNANSGALAGVDNSSHNSGNVAGTDMSRAVPAAYAPGLATTLTETCMGSSSAGVGFSGLSASFGTTWRDSSCTRRLDARQVSAFNNLPVAMEMMCDSELVREAAVRAGRPCVADGGVPFGVVAPTVVQEQVVPTPEAAAPVVTQQVHE
jgi:hypothetical protein